MASSVRCGVRLWLDQEGVWVFHAADAQWRSWVRESDMPGESRIVQEMWAFFADPFWVTPQEWSRFRGDGKGIREVWLEGSRTWRYPCSAVINPPSIYSTAENEVFDECLKGIRIPCPVLALFPKTSEGSKEDYCEAIDRDPRGHRSGSRIC
mmetsp:Transcript_10096/g.42418  ORF Transcript_10096/g.42418 Transcript_10096/m.42418 type:complete len:152 (-) Transcript_10096:998-1453(-)